jgi:hypothetical protein
MKQDLVCEYQGHRRGRKRKHASDTTIETTIARPRPQTQPSESEDQLQLDPRLEVMSRDVDSGPSRAPFATASGASSTVAANSNEAVIGDADQTFDSNTSHRISAIQSQPSGGAYGTFMLDPSAYYPYDVPSSHPSRQASPVDDLYRMRLPTAGPSSFSGPPRSDVRSSRALGYRESGTNGDLDIGDTANITSGMPTNIQDFGQSAPVTQTRHQQQVPPQPGRDNRSKAFEIKFSHVIPDEGDSSRKFRRMWLLYKDPMLILFSLS